MGTSVAFRVMGEVMLETLVELKTLPEPKTTVVFPSRAAPLGGAAINVAWYLGQLGQEVSLIASAGAEELKELRVLFSNLPCTLEGVWETPNSDRLITLLTPSSHLSTYELASNPATAIRRSNATSSGRHPLILNGGRHPDVRDAYVDIVASGRFDFIAFNPSYAVYEYSRPQLEEVIRGSNVVVLNQEEEAYVRSVGAGSVAPLEVMVVTRAEKGVYVRYPKPGGAYPAPASRPGVFLGAGDAFVAGFCSAFINDRELPQAVRAGQAVAQQVVMQGVVRATLQDH